MNDGAEAPLFPTPPQLRTRAEAELASTPPGKPSARSAEELLHELQVHQIELEMQNEALRQSLVTLEESRDAYTDLYDFAPVGYLTLTLQGLISKVNLTGAAQLDVPREKLLQRRFASFVSPDDQDRWYRYFSSVRGRAERSVAELSLQRGDGTVFHAQIDCARHAGETAGRDDEAATEIRMAVTDISLRKTAEQELAAARDAANRANQAKSAFLANMSHEMRTPLHVIAGLAHLLRRDLADPIQRERVDRLRSTSDHLLALINDVLDLSKIEARRFVLDRCDFRLDTVVGNVWRIVEARAREKGLLLAADIAPAARDLALNGDALRLAQVLINLCGNAIKFTDRGEVHVRIECVAEDSDCATLRFAVTDTGIGIPPAEQERLFRSFEQAETFPREREGTGLGLAISQHMVNLMGGTIRVDSRSGKGSTFSFTLVLPRAADGVPEAAAAVPAATSFHGRRVLLAEDHPIAQEILFEMLADMGFVVDVASDGAEAVACAQEHPYDIILMDMQMPGMDGLAATRAIRRIPGRRDTPIVALTANAFVEDRQRCLDAGMNAHMAKPVAPDTLAAVLGQWLPGSAAAKREDAAGLLGG